MSAQWDLGTALALLMFFLFILAAAGWATDKIDRR